MQTIAVTLPGNVEADVRYNLPSNAPGVCILSSGYGDDQFHEAVQLTLIDQLDAVGMAWVQYVYPERCSRNRFTDLYISTGIATLTWVMKWTDDLTNGLPCTLFGYSFGANISIEVALQSRVARLILVNTVFDYVDYREKQLGGEAISSWRRSQVAYLEYGNREYPLGLRFLQEAEQQDLAQRASDLDCDVYAFQAESDARLDPATIRELAKRSPRWHAWVIPGPDADHVLEDPAALRAFSSLAQPIVEKAVASDREG